MFRVYEEVCIGCGICRTECPNQAIEIKNKIAVLAPGAHCMSCGHCVAICPFNAVWQEGLDMSDVIPVTLSEAALKPNELLRAIKGRRSIRRFRTQQVEREKFEAMLEAARFTPSGSNRQGLSFVVVQDDIKNFTRLTIEALRRLGERLLSEGETDSLLRFYAPRFVELARQYEESDGAQDGLFFNAPAVIAVVGTRTIDAGLAASN
ncbi:MAG: nitroreductase family protein, partial [Oscillospiraceae bacterium]